MASPLITIQNVRKQFGEGVVAVEDMTLAINDGNFLSLLGPSGCGKSTVLKMIAGLLPVTRGRIRIAPLQGNAEKGAGVRVSGTDADALGKGVR